MKKLITIAVFSLILAVNTFSESDFSIVLYQPDNIISERVSGGVQEVASFIKVVKQVWKETIPSDEERMQTSIVLGLGYERQVTAWVLNSKSNINLKVTSALRKHKSPLIRNGYFAFALSGINFKNKEKKSFSPPMPAEWKDVAEKQSTPMLVDDILAILLPKSPNSNANVPDGFEKQLLEPLGGKILRPKDWFYSEKHGGPRYSWTISKENCSEKPYETGMKIQLFAGIKKGTGKTAKEFCNSFLLSKLNSTKVLTKFPETKQGMFTRKGIEVEEKIGSKTYHLIYSTFWLNPDIAIISIAGCPKSLWKKYKNTFQIMGGFELIDMKRF